MFLDRYVCAVTDGSEQAPAGWYNDPHAPERMRYFDGEMWTNHFHEPGKLPDVGSWLNTTFSVFGQYWRGAAALALITSLVGNLGIWVAIRSIVDNVAVVDEEFVNFGAGNAVALAVVVIFAFAWQGFGWLAMSRFMQRAHFQAEPTVAEALGHALRRLPKYLGVTLTLALAGVLLAIVVTFITVLVPVLGFVVIVGLVVTAVWVLVKLAFFVTAIAVVPAGTPVLRASADVSVGRFWPVLGRLLLITISLFVASQIITVGLGEFSQVVDAEALSDVVEVRDDTVFVSDFRIADLLPSTGQLAFVLIINSIVQAAGGLISTSAIMRLYLDSGAPSEIG
jgi:hypothetical protein